MNIRQKCIPKHHLEFDVKGRRGRIPKSMILTVRFQIAEVLCHHGGCPNLAPGGKKRAASHEVSRALSEMFDQSVALIHANVLGSDPDTFAFMSGRLRVHVSWGTAMRADTYMELFHELYKARARWHESPEQPINVRALNSILFFFLNSTIDKVES